MVLVSGYSIKELIFENDRTSIYRAIPDSSDCAVILKTRNKSLLNSEHKYRLKREFDFLQLLESPFTVKALEFIESDNQPVLVLEDTASQTLSPLSVHKTYSLSQKLQLLISITLSLHHIHSKKIIHKDINPSNILLDDEGQIRIIDLELSEHFSPNTSNVEQESLAEGALEYISPEQTGRMNNTIDYRTDFYSLGITFYQLLTGFLPFQAEDPLELIHCHIAKQPLLPSDIDESIPLVLSELVIKLIQKNASERYQSTKGILYDLNRCLSQITPDHYIPEFDLASSDVSDNFFISNHLYGRQDELRLLEDTYRKSSSGTNQIAMISGFSGLGKTSLASSLRKSIMASGGFFGVGKFGEFEKGMPYSALLDALKGMIRHLLTFPSAKIQQWKSTLDEALSPNAQLIIDILPELEHIIGKQPRISATEPKVSYHRFKHTMQKFVQTFATKDNPLALYLDDLQWADYATLELLRDIVCDTDTSYFFIIGSYRENEVGSNRKLIDALEAFEHSSVPFTHIELTPLSVSDISHLLADTFSRSINDINEFAHVVNAKSQGNPFFINQLLEQLYDEGLIYFSRVLERWEWNAREITEYNLVGDISSILKKKIERLPKETLDKLKIASCLGPRFTLNTLKVAVKCERGDIEQQIQPAINEGLLIKAQNNATALIPLIANSFVIPGHESYFIFSHDRVRQTVYDLHDRQEKALIHNTIASNLYKSYSEQTIATNVFGLVKHYNLGKEYLKDTDERHRVSNLNLLAAKKSINSNAYQASWDYASQALSLLDGNCWDTDYQLCLSVHEELVESAFLSSKYKDSERFANRILEHAQSKSHKALAISFLVQGYYAQEQRENAISTGVNFIREYNVSFPLNSTSYHLIRDTIKTKWSLRNHSFDSLLSLPEAPEDAEVNEYGEVINQLGVLSYRINPKLLPIIVLWGVRETCVNGTSKHTPISMAGYGMILANSLNDIEAGYQFGQVALKLAERDSSKDLAFRTQYACNSTLNYWKKPLKDFVDDFMENHKDAVRYGDHEMAQFSLYSHALYRFYIGDSIDICLNRYIDYGETIATYNQPVNILQYSILMQTMANLAGENPEPHILNGEYYSQEKNYSTHVLSNDKTALFKVHYCKMYLCYLMGHYADAVEHAEKASFYFEGEYGMFGTHLVYFYHSLSLLETYSTSRKKERLAILLKVNRNQSKLEKWSKICPENFINKHAIVEAKIATVRKLAPNDIFFKFDKAITLSITNNFSQEAAIANELAADYCLTLSSAPTLSKGYVLEAYQLIKNWNAIAKLAHFENKFHSILQLSREPVIETETTIDRANQATVQETSFTPAQETLGGGVDLEPHRNQAAGIANLDINSVLKASQMISKEIVLSKLLDETMNLIVENAGAQKGMILLDHDGSLRIEVTCDITKNDINLIDCRDFESSKDVAKSIVRYSYRTKDVILLNNAQKSTRFSQDPHIRSNAIKSVLCCPLINQGKLTGLVYLENNVSEASFTQKHVEVLGLLSSQSAISIEKARIFEKLEHRNTQISHLLDTTKELNSAKTKVEAAQVTLEHLLEATGQEKISEAILYLPQQNSDSSNGYTLIAESTPQNSPLPFIISDKERQRLSSLDQISFLNSVLSIPLKTERSSAGILVLDGWHSQAVQDSEMHALVEGMASTLAITMDNLNAEENIRLSSIGAMAASIVHDLKNPIGAIMGYADMADSDQVSKEVRSEYLSIIRKEANRMSDMAHEVLEFSAGKINLSRTVISTSEFLKDVSETLSSTFKHANMMYSATNDAPCMINIDIDHIRRVLLNLATNARDAMRNNQHHTGTFALVILKTSNGLKIMATDNGPGIPEQIRATLFEPFITHGKSNGTGLGMAIVKKTLDAHNGSIDFVTDASGTTFTLNFSNDIFFSEGSPVPKTTSLATNSAQLNSNLRVLVVEDNPVNQRLVKAMLKKLGLECAVAGDGIEALEQLKLAPFDVVLMDIEMPRMNGHETTRAIRSSSESYHSIPIIALTGHSGKEEFDLCMDAGMDLCVFKPIELSKLNEALLSASAAYS